MSDDVHPHGNPHNCPCGSEAEAPAIDIPRGLNAFVPGRPAPQGSKHYYGPGRVVEMSKYLKSWRDDVRSTLARIWIGQAPIEGAVHLELEFVLNRPGSTPKRWTPLAIKRPDWDKLSRAVSDAIASAGVYRDDSQVVRAVVTKRLAEIGETTGCLIRVQEIPQPERKRRDVDGQRPHPRVGPDASDNP